MIEKKIKLELTRQEIKNILFAISCVNDGPDQEYNQQINKIYKRLNKMYKVNIEKEDYINLINNHIETILIIWNNGKPTNTGRCDYYTIVGLDKDNKEITYNLSYGFSKVFGFRLSKDNQVLITGCGYSKTDHIIEHLKELKTELNFIVI